MSDYDNTDRGALFKNEKKENESQPDYTGNINVKGTEQRISAWLNTSKSGIKYLSIKCSDPMPREDAGAPSAPAPATAPAPLDDNIPF